MLKLFRICSLDSKIVQMLCGETTEIYGNIKEDDFTLRDSLWMYVTSKVIR